MFLFFLFTDTRAHSDSMPNCYINENADMQPVQPEVQVALRRVVGLLDEIFTGWIEYDPDVHTQYNVHSVICRVRLPLVRQDIWRNALIQAFEDLHPNNPVSWLYFREPENMPGHVEIVFLSDH